MGKRIESLADLLSRSTVTGSGCFEWGGARNKAGYGVARFDGATRLAHRVAYALANGVDVGLLKMICHQCDNPSCVNPNHLFQGSAADNSADMKSKGRQQRGDSHWRSKLCEEDVREIRCRLRTGEDQGAIATLFGVSKGAISNINTQDRWEGVQ